VAIAGCLKMTTPPLLQLFLNFLDSRQDGKQGQMQFGGLLVAGYVAAIGSYALVITQFAVEQARTRARLRALREWRHLNSSQLSSTRVL